MRRPNYDVPTALEIYFSIPEIGTKEIRSLFGCSRSKAQELKDEVMDYQKSTGEKVYHPSRVHTKTAYKVWGMDINEIERDFRALVRYGLR